MDASYIKLVPLNLIFMKKFHRTLMRKAIKNV